MSREQQTPIGQQSDERFISVLKEVSQLKETYWTAIIWVPKECHAHEARFSLLWYPE